MAAGLPGSAVFYNFTPLEMDDPSTLLTRTVACLYLFRDVCEAMTGRVPFDKRLDAYDKRAGQVWRELDDVAA
jgi:hypothetical protein